MELIVDLHLHSKYALKWTCPPCGLEFDILRKLPILAIKDAGFLELTDAIY